MCLDKQCETLDMKVITFIEAHTATKELLDHKMRDGPGAEVLNDDFHFGVV